MTKQPYPEEFKIEAVKQITERGYRVTERSAAPCRSTRPRRPVDADRCAGGICWDKCARKGGNRA